MNSLPQSQRSHSHNKHKKEEYILCNNKINVLKF